MSLDIRAFIINLERSPERRENMSQMLGRHAIQFEFVTAVDGQQLSDLQIRSVYDSARSFSELGRNLHKNEVACYLSHVEVLKKIVAEGIEEALIFEDDVVLFDDFSNVIKHRREWLPEDWALINLAHHIAPPINIRPLGESKELGRHSLCGFDRVVGGACAYLMRGTTAKILLERCFPIIRPWDDVVGSKMKVGSDIHGVVPRIVQWNNAFVSSIWVGQNMDEFSKECRSGLRGLWMRLRARVMRRLRRQ